MRSKRHDGIESVLRTAESDPSRDRILRTQFWVATSSPRGELITIESKRHPLSR